MRRRWLLLSVILAVCASMVVLSKAKIGPGVDTVYFDVRMQEDIGIQDVAAGKTDIFYYGLDGSKVKGLDRATLDKLEIYAIPSGSWSLLFNPVPDAAPYTVKAGGKEYFNPLAIREVRYAMNWLINRQYIVDEILAGAGGPMFTMATPGQPGTYRYNLIAAKLGMTAEGDEKKALAAIDAAMRKAAAIEANQGRLKKEGDWWTFDGEPVVIKFLIRVDDPNGRLKEGQYVAKQIEKAGLKVEQLLWDRAKCATTAYYSDPAKYEWHIYTEGWGAGATRAYWDLIVCQMYAPFYGNMPGGADPNNWNYQNEEIDELAQKAYTGNILTDQEYWDTALKAQELGLKEAVRIYVAYQTQFYLARKDRFLGRFAYGLGDGLNEWSLITARTKDAKLRATQFSAKGALFMSAWDPVGADGFNDVYSRYIAEPLVDESMFESPVTALADNNRAIPVKVESKVHKENGKVVGEIKVPAAAVIWDSKNDKWVKVASGKTAMSTGTYKFRFSDFHHGIPMSLLDYIYADAFVREWITKDGEDDPYFDETYSSVLKPLNETSVGTVYDFKNKTITTYFDYNFPTDKGRVAMWGAPVWYVTAASGGIGTSWEITEALARMVAAKKSASGTVYSFSSSVEGATEVDALNPTCVSDIKAELQKMVKEKYIPASLRGYLSAASAVARYNAAVKFIEKYGHAYIGNGPFYLARFDPKSNFAQLNAFRDPSYPFDADYWRNRFKATILTVERIELPPMSEKGKDVAVKVHVSQSIYPDDAKTPATQGTVSLLLITDKGEQTIKAARTKAGVYEAAIPGSLTKGLETGSYTLLAIAEVAGASPSTASGALVLY